MNEGETKFLNLDVDVWSGSPLNDLADAFGKKAYAVSATA
jgi:hypothetical protein